MVDGGTELSSVDGTELYLSKVLVELLVQGKVRASRVTLHLRQLHVRDDNVITVGILDIYDQHARGRQ